MEYQKLWMDTLNRLEQLVSKPSFDTWLKKTHFSRQEDNIIYINTENEFQRDWLEGRYSEPVNKIIKEISKNDKLTVSYVCTSSKDPLEGPISARHYNHKEDLLERIEMLENKVLSLESDIAEMKRKN